MLGQCTSTKLLIINHNIIYNHAHSQYLFYLGREDLTQKAWALIFEILCSSLPIRILLAPRLPIWFQNVLYDFKKAFCLFLLLSQ